jgi:hypothetical protein
MTAMPSAATGSAHHHPAMAFAVRPIRSTHDNNALERVGTALADPTRRRISY